MHLNQKVKILLSHFWVSLTLNKWIPVDESEDFEIASILQSHTQDVKFVVWHPVDEVFTNKAF